MAHKEQVWIGVHGKNVSTHGQSRHKSSDAAIRRVFLQIFENVLNQHLDTLGDWNFCFCDIVWGVNFVSQKVGWGPETLWFCKKILMWILFCDSEFKAFFWQKIFELWRRNFGIWRQIVEIKVGTPRWSKSKFCTTKIVEHYTYRIGRRTTTPELRKFAHIPSMPKIEVKHLTKSNGTPAMDIGCEERRTQVYTNEE